MKRASLPLPFRRREFITLLGGAAAAWPIAARAQQLAMPVIGYLSLALDETELRLHVAPFKQGLQETGYIDGQNVMLDLRSARNQNDRLPVLALELVRRPASVIMAAGSYASRAAQASTSTVPIVFAGGFDPVALGLVASLNRPGRNVTGVSFLANSLDAKRLGLLRTAIPRATSVAVLLNPNNESAEGQLRELREAARVLGMKVVVAKATSEKDFEPAFSDLVRQGADVLVIAADVFFTGYYDRLVALALRHSLPAVFPSRDYALLGGLMSYGASVPDSYRQAGIYVGRILRGEKPADLPVMQPTKFELTINLKTAKALGLTIPDGLQLAADEVIE